MKTSADRIGVSLTDAQIDAFCRYQSMLERWNRVYNLTALRDSNQIRVQHLADCLAVLPALSRQLPTGGGRILDVGSGGGLPGAVIAIALPSTTVCCVDSVGKKVAFLRQVVAELGIRNLGVAHARVETLPASDYDVVVSRAFASLNDFARLTANQLAPGGVWMAMKGRRPEEEMAELPTTVHVFHVEPIHVPESPAERCLVWMRPHLD